MKRLPLLLIVMAAHASAPAWEQGNRFALAYHDWAILRNARVSSEVTVDNLDAREVAAWQKARAAWRALEASVNGEYR